MEGQLLSSLRSRILGRQGTYVTLGFRRKEGMETTYYDVPLMRGSSEYFDSLKANQPLQVPETSTIQPPQALHPESRIAGRDRAAQADQRPAGGTAC